MYVYVKATTNSHKRYVRLKLIRFIKPADALTPRGKQGKAETSTDVPLSMLMQFNQELTDPVLIELPTLSSCNQI